MQSAARFSSTCTSPSGQRMVSFLMAVSSPRPKWTREVRWRPHALGVELAHLHARAVSARSSAPMPSRFGGWPASLTRRCGRWRCRSGKWSRAVLIGEDEVEDAAVSRSTMAQPKETPRWLRPQAATHPRTSGRQVAVGEGALAAAGRSSRPSPARRAWARHSVCPRGPGR